jgi:cytochrome P450
MAALSSSPVQQGADKTPSNTSRSEDIAEAVNRKNQNLLSLLVQSGMFAEGAEDSSKNRLTTKEILGNAFIFMLAGHETSAHALSFALALLALHPEEQETLYKDVQRVLNDPSRAATNASAASSDKASSDVTQKLLYRDIDKLEYCNAVMKEALRLFPPVVTIPKVAAKDTEVEDGIGRKFTVPKGALMNLQVYAMHRNAEYYPDPDEFKPSRWIGRTKVEETGDSAASCQFAAFSLGNRSCIGRRFAQIEIVVTLAMISQRYTISVPEGMTKERLLATKNLLTLYPANDDGLIFTERK